MDCIRGEVCGYSLHYNKNKKHKIKFIPTTVIVGTASKAYTINIGLAASEAG
jgi:hypothetical protein